MSDQSKYIWFNGAMVPWKEAKVHVMSHAIHYGSGVWEGIKCYKTEDGPAIFKLDGHIRRLYNSAKNYDINIPYSPNEIKKACINVVDVNEFDSCYIRPIAFYGFDTLGVHPKDCPVEVSVASFYWGAYLGEDSLQNGVRVTISPWKRLSLNAFPPSTKASGHYLNSLLAVQDARKRGFDEAILFNEDNLIAEGSGQNIFIVKNNEIFTNSEDASILMGITRETVIELCNELNIKIHVTNISGDMLNDADEAFFTGTATEVTPIASIDDRPVNTGEPGEITLKLRDIYLDIAHGKNPKYKKWLTLTEKHKDLDLSSLNI